jgi:hypothetical protein
MGVPGQRSQAARKVASAIGSPRRSDVIDNVAVRCLGIDAKGEMRSGFHVGRA